MSASDNVTVSSEQTSDNWTEPHLFGHQDMPIVRVYRTLPAVVYPVVLVYLTSWVLILELKHEARETIYRI